MIDDNSVARSGHHPDGFHRLRHGAATVRQVRLRALRVPRPQWRGVRCGWPDCGGGLQEPSAAGKEGGGRPEVFFLFDLNFCLKFV